MKARTPTDNVIPKALRTAMRVRAVDCFTDIAIPLEGIPVIPAVASVRPLPHFTLHCAKDRRAGAVRACTRLVTPRHLGEHGRARCANTVNLPSFGQ
jgi:hypothetical protein